MWQRTRHTVATFDYPLLSLSLFLSVSVAFESLASMDRTPPFCVFFPSPSPPLFFFFLLFFFFFFYVATSVVRPLAYVISLRGGKWTEVGLGFFFFKIPDGGSVRRRGLLKEKWVYFSTRSFEDDFRKSCSFSPEECKNFCTRTTFVDGRMDIDVS